MKMQIIETSCNRRRLELEQVRNYFEGNDYEIISEDFEVDKSADIILLSTCGFTQAAEDFGLKTLERINKEKSGTCRLVVGGCLPKINPGVLKDYDTIDPRNYEKLDDYTGFAKKFDTFERPNTLRNWNIHSSYREHGLMSTDEKVNDIVAQDTRKDNIEAVKKISDDIYRNTEKIFRVQCVEGCSSKCTYCAIKLAIGKSTSKSKNELLSIIQKGIDEGYKKISLEGDSLGGYGLDIGTNLGELLDGLIELVKDKDIEVSITDVSPMYLKYCYKQVIKLAQMKKISNFYIPVQSGSQKIINTMRRGYDIDKVKEIIKEIKNTSGLNVGTSIIIGFPGETLEDLQKTIDMCRELEFNYIFTHSFSSRPNTEAYELPEKISGEEILRRSRQFKDAVKECTDWMTIAEDTKGNRSCQG